MLFDSKLPQRVWANIYADPSGCWLWRGALNFGGYGTVYWHGRIVMVHRLMYETFVGPIPAGLVSDHLCRNYPCCNPRHIEPVTDQVNILRGIGLAAQNARKTHCPRGHEYDLLNTKFQSHGKGCRVCFNQDAVLKDRARRARFKAEGLCRYCRKPNAPGYTACAECVAHQREQRRTTRSLR